MMEEFEKVVQDSLGCIPTEFRKILTEEKIKILPREKVPKAIKEKFPGKIIFGVFVGIPRKSKTVFSIQKEPTRIELYKESFQKVFGSKIEEMENQICRTVIHEIAHYFGFDEEEVRKRGY